MNNEKNTDQDPGSTSDQRERVRRPKDRLPPQLEPWYGFLLILGEILTWGSAAVLAGTCLGLIFGTPIKFQSACWIYIPGALFLVGLYMVRLIRHDLRVHEVRLVHRSEAEALFSEAEGLLQTNTDDKGYDPQHQRLKKLIDKRADEGPETWTEYRVLAVEQAMIDLLPTEDLVARTRSRLETLNDYNEKKDVAEIEYFSDQQQRVRDLIDETENTEEAKNSGAPKLRAELKSLLESLADYDLKWATGSEILRGLLIVTALTVPILLLMGVAPTLMPTRTPLGFLNWALLGASGSFTSVLLNLYHRPKVEVGDTEGKNELYRATGGAVLGFVAGFLVYAMFLGELIIEGYIVPDVNSVDLGDSGLSVVWAFVAGFSFEGVFERVRAESIS